MTLPIPDHWQGDINDLARKAENVLHRGEIHPRIIRDYQRRGILSQPQRVGRRALYRQRHVLELISARILLADGWPLGKIAQTLARMSIKDIAALIEGHIRPVFDEAGNTGKKNRSSKDLPASSLRAEYSSQIQPGTSGFARKATMLASERASLQSARHALNLAGEPPAARQRTHFELAPWAHLVVDTEKIGWLTDREAIELGRLVTATLATHDVRRG